MFLCLDETSSESLRSQIAAGVRRALSRGEFTEGERLPPASQVARSLGVNVHTVLGAYQDLRDEGLIDLRRGRGATVLRRAKAQASIGELAQGLMEEAKRLGMSTDEVLAMIRRQA